MLYTCYTCAMHVQSRAMHVLYMCNHVCYACAIHVLYMCNHVLCMCNHVLCICYHVPHLFSSGSAIQFAYKRQFYLLQHLRRSTLLRLHPEASSGIAGAYQTPILDSRKSCLRVHDIAGLAIAGCPMKVYHVYER